MSGDDDLPFSSARRWWATGRAAARAATGAARRVVGAAGDAADRRWGEQLASQLDELKGAAMKVGQILSYMDGVLPDETAAALAALQQGARGIPADRARAVVEEALGAPVDALFERFDDVPVAAASIGQVHRARHDGVEVAVKVQYPGVRETLDADAGRLHRIAGLASLATAVDGHAIAEDLRRTFVAECDYVAEAGWQRWFSEAFAADPRVRIPAVVPERSADRVLTTRFVEGRSFQAFAADAPPEARLRAAEALFAFPWTSLLRWSVLNADPHPGNYVFDDEGVWFLDFGCVRRFDPDVVAGWRRLIRVVVEDRRDAFEEALLGTGLVARPEGFDFDGWWDVEQHLFAPYRDDVHRIDRGHLLAGAELMGPTNPNLRRVAISPAWVWLQRMHWGLQAVLAKLDVEAPYRAWLEAALAQPPEAPPDPP